jgi:putative oxidoreductase
LAWCLLSPVGMALDNVSIAERLAFGRPLDPDRDPEVIHVVARPKTALIGRVLLSAIFLTSGIAKVTDPAGTIGYMNAAGIPAAEILVWVAALAEIFGGLSILFGFLTRVGALGLSVFMVFATLLFHDFWSFTGAEQKTQMVNFMKNLAIMGGLFMLIANGAGRYSVDNAIRRPFSP